MPENEGGVMRVLLVEDDTMLGEGVQIGLRQLGFAVDWVQDGVAANRALQSERFAAVVLDIGLPGMDGLSLLRALRERRDLTPVLLLTARDQGGDRVRGLDAGADDYVVKPFDLDELGARLRALVRRSGGQADNLLRWRDVVLDRASRSVSRAGEEVILTTREFDLLELLMQNAGRVLTRRSLEEQLYTWGEQVESNALEVHVHHLRRKLGGELIKTVRGVGYALGAEGA